MMTAFSVIALFTFALGVVTVGNLARLHEDQKTYSSDIFAGADLLAQYTDLTWESRALLLTYLLENNALNRAWIRQRILDSDRRATELLQRVDQVDSDRDGLEDLASMESAWRSYTAWRDLFIFPAVENGNFAGAMRAYREDGARLADLVDRAGDRAFESKRQGAQKVANALEETYDRMYLFSIGIVIGATAVALLIGYVLSGSISAGLRRATQAARRIANGELQIVRDEMQSNDEIGQLSQSFDDMMRYLRNLADAADAISTGDLTREVGVQSPQDRLGHAFRQMTHTLRLAASQIQGEQRALRQSEERFRALVQNSSELLTVLDADGYVKYQSPSIESLLGGTVEDIEGGPGIRFVAKRDRRRLLRVFEEIKRNPGQEIRVELKANDVWGRPRVLEAILTNLLDNPSVNGIVINSRDISERKRLEEQLVHQALHDPLTLLPNRVLFVDRLQQAIARRQRTGKPIAVLFLDLDGFKTVNDSLGHKSGDILLMQVGERISKTLRIGDTVARLGGDEFTILLEDVTMACEATVIAQRLLREMETPFMIDGHEVFVTISIGVAIGNYDSPNDYLRDADTAMYEAKRRGKACYEVFTPQMNAKVWRRLELESDMRHGLERGDFYLLFQPIVDLNTGRLQHVEALARWQHPRLGLISPNEFIPLAEETGMIIQLGAWVMAEAIRVVTSWDAVSSERIPVAVNLSARQFLHSRLVEDVNRLLVTSGIAPSRLQIEITESVMMQEVSATVQTLQQLKALGLSLAIDDFGTGYSSLAYLKRFPIDEMKIDRSFVSGIASDSEDYAIVRTIISLARSLNLKVVGEGIETPEQLDCLRDLGCQLGQGFYFAKPMTAEMIASRYLMSVAA